MGLFISLEERQLDGFRCRLSLFNHSGGNHRDQRLICHDLAIVALVPVFAAIYADGNPLNLGATVITEKPQRIATAVTAAIVATAWVLTPTDVDHHLDGEGSGHYWAPPRTFVQ